MRLLFITQRYGAEVAGGAEAACRMYAEQMVQRDHSVEVATTTAKDYVEWKPHYPAGEETIADVIVRRFDVGQTRDDEQFNAMYGRTVWGSQPVPLYMQQEWMRFQGPYTPKLTEWLVKNAAHYDVVVFFSYLYWTTWAGMRAAAGRTAVVLHPAAHDEPPLRLPLFRLALNIPDGMAFFTEEEQDIVQRELGVMAPSRVLGMGIDTTPRGSSDQFRAQYPDLGDRPYLLLLGRVEAGKGSDELIDFFRAYKERNENDLALVVVGDRVREVEAHPDVFMTGFVSQETKYDALDGCTALVQPSYFESFSIVLCEAWVAAKPAIVQGHCGVLTGQSRRSGGGLPYLNFAEFEAAVDVLLADPELASAMGAAGRAYVEQRYGWDDILTRYETFLTMLANAKWPSAEARSA